MDEGLTPATGRLAVLVDRYPCVSESFVQRELSRLEAFGFTLAVVACRPALTSDSWLSSELSATVFCPAHALRGGWPHLARNTVEALRFASRARALFPRSPRGAVAAARAAWTAAQIAPPLEAWRPDWLHAHFLGAPAAVACLIAGRLGIPLTLSAHARDVFVPASRLERVCAEARWVTACSEHAQASLMGRLPSALAKRVFRVPHDVACGPSFAPSRRCDGEPLNVLSVCRLVPKKGIDIVLRALALLHDVPYRYRIVGTGPELARLRALARELTLAHVEFVGTLSPAAVAQELARADVFVLGTRAAPDGDRDGIPNAILEAMAAGVPVIASDGGAVSEVIRHRRSGWLVPPNDPHALAEAIREAAADHALSRTVAQTAHAEVLRRFSTDRTPSLLALWISGELGMAGASPPLAQDRQVGSAAFTSTA